MPKINTAEDAVQIASRFLDKYHAFTTLKKVIREGDKWITEFDVGILSTEIVRVTLNTETGSVIAYEKVK